MRATFIVLAAAGVFAGAAAAEPTISQPFDPGADCITGLDTLGSVVASGGDFNGDGFDDFAYAAPCSHFGEAQAGQVWIRDGKDGRLLRRARGGQNGAFFGAAVAFVGDIDGDGADEVAVGAPGYDTPNPTSPANLLRNAGQVRVFTSLRRGPLMRFVGTEADAELGASVAGNFHFDGDAVVDLAIGAPGQPVGDQKRGAVFLISGIDGELIDTVFGESRRQFFGINVTNVGEADPDDVEDFLVTSKKNPVGDVEDGGALVVLKGTAPDEEVFPRFGGALHDRLGASTDSEGTDGSFIVGSPGELPEPPDEPLQNAGAAFVFNGDGTNRYTVRSDEPQKNAQFGTAVAVVGDVTADEIAEFAVSAPFHDVTVGSPPALVTDAGRITIFSGVDGTALDVFEGATPGMLMGRALAGRIDLNGDNNADIVSGNPGDMPLGRRSAGTVNVYSGITGNLIRSFRGHRGLETRVFAANPAGDVVRGVRFDNTPAGVDETLFADAKEGELSVAVLDEQQRPRVPGTMRIAVGTGHGATDPSVVVMRARNGAELDAFDVFEYAGGANVAGGDLDDDGADELIAVQADADTVAGGSVSVRVYKGLPSDPPGTGGWLLDDAFVAFAADAQLEGVPIDADGANVATVDLPGSNNLGIAVAPVIGAPVVRVLSQTGTDVVLPWFAYEPEGFSGVYLAAVDLDGDGDDEIVTAPRTGQAFIRAFDVDGTPFEVGGQAVTFLAFPSDFTGGATVAGADVDYDGRQEILVAAGPGRSSEILAFEADGTPVAGFTPLTPFDTSERLSIAGTDHFVRR